MAYQSPFISLSAAVARLSRRATGLTDEALDKLALADAERALRRAREDPRAKRELRRALHDGAVFAIAEFGRAPSDWFPLSQMTNPPTYPEREEQDVIFFGHTDRCDIDPAAWSEFAEINWGESALWIRTSDAVELYQAIRVCSADVDRLWPAPPGALDPLLIPKNPSFENVKAWLVQEANARIDANPRLKKKDFQELAQQYFENGPSAVNDHLFNNAWRYADIPAVYKKEGRPKLINKP